MSARPYEPGHLHYEVARCRGYPDRMEPTTRVAPHLQEALDRARRIASEATQREEDAIDQSSTRAYLAFIAGRQDERL